MNGTEQRLRSLRPGVAAPDPQVRAHARARLMGVIEETMPAPLAAGRSSHTGRRRPVLTGLAVVGVAILLVAVVVTSVGHRRRSGISRPPAPAAVLSAEGGPLGGALAAAVRREYHRQLAAGHAVRTFLSPSLQRVAQAALHHAERVSRGARGTVVAMNPDTGALAAITSVPGAVSVAHPVGSVLDPFTGLDALDAGLWSAGETYDDTGELCISAGGCRHNAEHTVAGVIDLPQALAAEDQLFFEHLGLLLRTASSADAGHGSLARFGFGTRTGVDLPGESAGRISGPSSPALAADRAVGLGPLLITPIQLAVAYGALANGGTIVVPQVGRVLGASGGRTSSTRVAGAGVSLGSRALASVREGLRGATSDRHVPPGTTGVVFAGLRATVSGLVSTVASDISLSGRNHPPALAWYAGYVTGDGRPPLVVVVEIPGGGYGARTAAPVARQVFSQWETGSPGPWRPGSSRAQ